MAPANFMELTQEYPSIPQIPRALPRMMTVPGIIPDDSETNIEDNDTSTPRERRILVANMLPLNAEKDAETGKYSFTLDEDSLLLQLKDGFPPETEVIYVGCLNIDVEINEQDEVSQILLDNFNCVPTFLSREIYNDYYHGFCKKQLWPLFHYQLPISPDHGERFDRKLWKAYVTANKLFADKVLEVASPEEDYIWIQDYHLMILPTFLRRRYHRCKLGFFLHSPFPSSEIYRTLPVRDEILRSLLSCDLIGFQTFDYARHLLSCCSRLLGLDYESKRGHICLDFYGRTVYVKILPVGVHMGRLESVLNLPSTLEKFKEIQERFEGKTIILGVDDMDIFKGISLKLLAFEQFLKSYPDFHGKVVLIQIVNPARSSGKDVQEAMKETYTIVTRINETYGSVNYKPVELIDRPVPRYEKTAYYAMADCCIVNAVRDGMNLIPYKYIVCRERSLILDEGLGVKHNTPRTSMLIVSEFIGCSPSLSGAIRVNPWNINAVAEALFMGINIRTEEMQLRHKKHYKYIKSHDVAYWARSFSQDLEKACKDHYSKRCWGIGLGLGFRVIALSPGFRKLTLNHIVSSYTRTTRRAIFLDFDGTLVPQSSMMSEPNDYITGLLNTLSNDPKNTVFIVSGRGRPSLSEWFAPCKNLGLATEHGYFIRWNKESEWECLSSELDWIEIAEPVMKLYTEATDGSFIEKKESALVWHHRHADPDFGSCQSKELLDHLENVLANEPAVVKRGQHIVEVKPQGVTKGLVTEKVLQMLVNKGTPPDFVMCIGDDRSDEDMFESVTGFTSAPCLPTVPEIFACTVGQKPSKAKYYLYDTADVQRTLHQLANVSDPDPHPDHYPIELNEAFEHFI